MVLNSALALFQLGLPSNRAIVCALELTSSKIVQKSTLTKTKSALCKPFWDLHVVIKTITKLKFQPLEVKLKLILNCNTKTALILCNSVGREHWFEGCFHSCSFSFYSHTLVEETSWPNHRGADATETRADQVTAKCMHTYIILVCLLVLNARK